jgi:uncharacterized membrane protein
MIMHGGIEQIIHVSMQVVSQTIELLAVGIILVGVTGGTVRFFFGWSSQDTYKRYKETLDKALLLGLNVLVAADIVRTVALDPTITNLFGLGLLVLVRTFVSWSLLIEVEGRWPWQSQPSSSATSKP